LAESHAGFMAWVASALITAELQPLSNHLFKT